MGVGIGQWSLAILFVCSYVPHYSVSNLRRHPETPVKAPSRPATILEASS